MDNFLRSGLAGALLACCLPVSAQDAASLTFAGYALSPDNADRVSLEEDGTVLVVDRTGVRLDGAEFSEGVIEFDVAFEDRFGFGGVQWHLSDDGGTAEYLYLRQHKSGEPDAVQYTPVRDGLSSWQIFADANAIAPFAFAHEGWNRLKLVVAGDKADIYFNGSTQPQLHVPDLATDRGSGGVGLRATGANGKLRFRNLTIRPLATGERIVGQPAAVASPPAGVIVRWSISDAFAEAEVADVLLLPDRLAALPAQKVLAVEPTGIVDLSRAGVPGRPADTRLVSTNIRSESARPVRLQFGYSDRVRLFLDGKLVFDGIAGWRTRDEFFLGTVGFNDAVTLQLDAGDNVLTAAVSETFGGWAFAGAISDREGLMISPSE